MPFRDIEVPWTEQPQEFAQLDAAQLGKFGIVGGLIAGGGVTEPQNLDSTPPSRGAGNYGWRPIISPHGLSAEWYDDGAGRYLTYKLGSVSARNFSLLARIRADAGAIFCRSGTTGAGTTLPLWRNSGFDMRVNGTDYAAAGTWNYGQWYDIEIVGAASSCQLFVDDALTINGGAAAAGNLDANFAIGDVTGGNLNSGDLKVSHILWCDRALTASERAILRANPWQLFQSRSERIWMPAGAALPTLSLPTFVPGSITASGFRPRVTAT